MCKNFVVISSKGRREYECIGDIFIMREKEQERAIASVDAERRHHDALNRARMVRMRKHVDMIMV